MMCGFLFKQKTAYEWRISDWSSDVCSSDLQVTEQAGTDARVEDEGQLADRRLAGGEAFDRTGAGARADGLSAFEVGPVMRAVPGIVALHASAFAGDHARRQAVAALSIARSEEHTYESQSLMRNPYAVFRLNKKNYIIKQQI